MKANYHTHTERCKHAYGSEREYVEEAIKGGLEVLGFSDHTPYPFPKNYTSRIRMDMDELDDYVDTVLALKKEYKSDIDIRLGLEAEYFPRYFDALMDAIDAYPVEYLLLGQHYPNNEIGEPYCGSYTEDRSVFLSYCEQVREGIKTGRFTYLAHPDLIWFGGSDELYGTHMREICILAKEYDLPLEINLQGIWMNRNYPDERFWKIAGEVGNTCIMGADAHRPGAVVAEEAEKAATELAARCDLRLLERLDL